MSVKTPTKILQELLEDKFKVISNRCTTYIHCIDYEKNTDDPLPKYSPTKEEEIVPPSRLFRTKHRKGRRRTNVVMMQNMNSDGSLPETNKCKISEKLHKDLWSICKRTGKHTYFIHLAYLILNHRI